MLKREWTATTVRNQEYYLVVLNRTSVAKIVPYQQSDAISIPVLKQLGPNFDFSAEKHGGDRSYDSTKLQFGPDLAHVMDWYWDPVTEEEVCYYKNGEEHMRYDRRSKQHTYRNTGDLHRSVVDEMALFGMISPPSTAPLPSSGFISLGERSEAPTRAPRQRQARQTSTTTDS